MYNTSEFSVSGEKKTKRHSYTAAEKKIIRDMYVKGKSDADIAAALDHPDVNEDKVKSIRIHYGLVRGRTRMRGQKAPRIVATPAVKEQAQTVEISIRTAKAGTTVFNTNAKTARAVIELLVGV
jgi:hypothetical protein